MSFREFSEASTATLPGSVGAGGEDRVPTGRNAERIGDEGREQFQVLGVKIDALQIPEVILEARRWIARRDGTSRYIAVTGMHGIIEARHDREYQRVLEDADLVVADGMPVVWIGRFKGYPMERRVYGPELMFRFCQETAASGYRHYFAGGALGVADHLAQTLEKKCPGIAIAGTCSPPFRATTAKEDAAIIDAINKSAPDVLWLGLGTPKQELWMRKHRDKLRVPVMIGVGAAFDFLSSRKKQAPVWMQEHGFEWLFRLCQEPVRLWRRYLVGGAEFCFLAGMELLGLRRFE